MDAYKVELFRKFCKSCQICLRICPKQVFTINERGQVIIDDQSKCIGCMQCYNLCPDFALEVTKNGD